MKSVPPPRPDQRDKPSSGPKQRRCKNCDVALKYFSDKDGYFFCEDCCRIGKQGMFLGGLVIGLVAALIKLIG